MDAEITDARSVPAESALAPFQALHVDLVKLKRRLSALGPAGIGEFDLKHITVPTGETPAFMIQKPDGSPSMELSFRAIILSAGDRRAFWPTKKITNTPPQCSSPDAITGYGNPGGSCKLCPLSQFGSGPSDDGQPGKGQACKQTKQVVIARAGESKLPEILTVPPSSLVAFKDYHLLILGADLDIQGVVTEVSLEPAQGASGKYMRLKFSRAAVLQESETDQVLHYIDQVGNLIAPAQHSVAPAPAPAQIAAPGAPARKEAF